MQDLTFNRFNQIIQQQKKSNNEMERLCAQQNSLVNISLTQVNNGQHNFMPRYDRDESSENDQLLTSIRQVIRQSVTPLFQLPKSNINQKKMLQQLQKLKAELQIKEKLIIQQTNQITKLRQENGNLLFDLNKMKRQHDAELFLRNQQIRRLKNKMKKCVSTLGLLRKGLPLIKQHISKIRTECKNSSIRAQIQANSLEQLNFYMRKVKFDSQFDNKRKQKQARQQYQQKLNLVRIMEQDIGGELSKEFLDQSYEELNFEKRLNKFNKLVKSYIKLSSAFAGSQIVQEGDHKGWLMDHIEHMINSNKVKTHLLYRFDQLNGTNFHKYIDGKYNVLVVIQLVGGLKIGGFCVTPFTKQKIQKHKNGFLFSLSLFQQYVPKNDAIQSLVSYDDYFLIFGNSEIRIKSQEAKIFSNFSTSAGVYNANGRKVQDFIGVNASETAIENYEIYEIIMK